MNILNSYSIELFLRLIAAVVLGGIVGFERGGTKHAAGLRTHTILCLGAASVMVISECIVRQYGINQEIMRMGAQVISGVGFLGAGNIIVNGGEVHGITTATGLWTTACVGIAVGSGYYLIALFVVILMLSVMLGLKSMSQKIRTEQEHCILKLETEDVFNMENILNKLLQENTELNNIRIEQQEEGVDVTIDLAADKQTVEKTLVKLAGQGIIKEFSVTQE